MKMADDTEKILQNTCETKNNKQAEATVQINGTQNINNDITTVEAINKSDQSQETTIEEPVLTILAQEDAVNEFLAGEEKNEFAYILEENLEINDEGIDLKVENSLEIPEEIQELTLEKDDERVNEDDSPNSKFRDTWTWLNFLAKGLKKRSIKCLNKMQIMEDVREGCNVQPSSPGHAEQRSDDVPIKTETINENGYETHNSVEPNREEGVKQEVAKEEKKSDSENEDAKIEDNYSNASSPGESCNKRKCDDEDTPIKRLRTEIQENFATRDKILNEFMEMADCNTFEQIQMFSEQLLADIKTLNELAKEKEREWNNIIHMKKIKEELLIRMQRKKQVMMIGESELSESQLENYGQQQSLLKSNQKPFLRVPNFDKNKTRCIQGKPSAADINSALDFRQNRRPTLDVQSIIADYRQRHPEAVPRRGRRIRNSSDGSKNSVLNFSSVALGTGAQVKQQTLDMSGEFGAIMSSINGTSGSSSPGRQTSEGGGQIQQDNRSFKDMLVQFARLSQSERNELIQSAIKPPPPPYPEVTVHPVPVASSATTSSIQQNSASTPTSSLLHGILTKTPTRQANTSPNTNGNNTKTAFSPTLARLLTAPERSGNGNNSHATSTPNIMTSSMRANNMSISEILSSSKARNEITITPVDSQYETTPTKTTISIEDESEEGVDRLVIDESGEKKEDNTSDAGDEVPQCQGCNQKPAQFVCAGCGNQWYCSRDCQVAAWDEHSEVCSG